MADANVTLRGRDDKVNLGGQYNYADNTDSATDVTTLNARNFQLFGTYSHLGNLSTFEHDLCILSILQEKLCVYIRVT